MSLEALVSARVNLGMLDRAWVALRNPDLRPAWKESRKPLRQDQRDHAKQQAGPGGAWAPRASSTKVRAASGRRRSRKLLGRLPTALTSRSDRKRVIIRSLVKWSISHWRGERVGHGARLPARVFLWVSDRATETVSGIVARHVAKMVEGR